MENISEMTAGDGGGLAMPPAFVFVNPRQHRRYKKNNQDKVDGRTSGARALMSRINRRKMKEELENTISEAAPTETESPTATFVTLIRSNAVVPIPAVFS